MKCGKPTVLSKTPSLRVSFQQKWNKLLGFKFSVILEYQSMTTILLSTQWNVGKYFLKIQVICLQIMSLQIWQNREMRKTFFWGTPILHFPSQILISKKVEQVIWIFPKICSLQLFVVCTLCSAQWNSLNLLLRNNPLPNPPTLNRSHLIEKALFWN